MTRRPALLAAAALAVVGLVVGLVVSAPWDSGGRHHLDSLGAPRVFASKPKPVTHRPVIGAATTPSTLTQDEITAVVAAHNAWRQKYGVAQQIAWDDTVAGVAQDWANRIATTGQFDHRPDGADNPDSSPYGENLFAWWASDPATINPQFVVDRWGGEDADYNRVTKTCADGKVCGHFTQVVWATTTKVGCGKASPADDASQVYWVCNYDPPGNFGRTDPFTGQRLGS
jgi:cysteine-rich secretory family protein